MEDMHKKEQSYSEESMTDIDHLQSRINKVHSYFQESAMVSMNVQWGGDQESKDETVDLLLKRINSANETIKLTAQVIISWK